MAKSVVMVISSLSLGGAERSALDLCHYLVNKNIHVHLILTGCSMLNSAFEIDRRIVVTNIVKKSRYSRKNIFSFLEKIIRLKYHIKRIKPDSVISYIINVNILTILATRFSCTKVYVSERSYPGSRNYGLLIDKLRELLYPFATGIVVQTKVSSLWVRDHIKAKSVITIPNAVNYPISDSLAKKVDISLISKGKKIILLVSRLIETKNIDVVVDAFFHISNDHSEWVMVILGDGPLMQTLQEKIDLLNLKDRCFLLGDVGNLHDWYSRSSMFILNSSVEGFPNSLIEAMSYGLVPISTDCLSGPSEIINDGENGFLIPTGSEAQYISDIISKIIANPKLMFMLSMNARKITSKLNRSGVYSKWIELL